MKKRVSQMKGYYSTALHSRGSDEESNTEDSYFQVEVKVGDGDGNKGGDEGGGEDGSKSGDCGGS